MADDIAKVKSLRDSTGLSFGEIKKALDEARGDEAKAAEILKVRSGALAAKRSERAVKEGVVEAYIHGTRKIGALVELLCETDFVAKNEEFRTLAKDMAMQAAAMKTSDAAELLAQPFIKDPAVLVKDHLNAVVAKLGENIQLGRVSLFEL